MMRAEHLPTTVRWLLPAREGKVARIDACEMVDDGSSSQDLERDEGEGRASMSDTTFPFPATLPGAACACALPLPGAPSPPRSDSVHINHQPSTIINFFHLVLVLIRI
jgi:hypothetical protein